MFMLYAIVIGLIAGLAVGGRLRSLGLLQFRWAWLAIAGLWVQLVLFSAPVTAVVGDLGPPIYVGSTLVVLAVVLVNSIRVPGLVLVATGAAANLAAIVANGGFMPATPEALAGRAAMVGYSNSVELAQPALAPLVDRFAMPSALPFANIFSVGDVLIGLGVVIVIVVTMVRTRPEGLDATADPNAPASRVEAASTPP
jgi:hypothetical protein